MNYENAAALQASMSALRHPLNQGNGNYQQELLKTIQTLYYKKYEIENYLQYLQQQIQTQQPYYSQPTPPVQSTSVVNVPPPPPPPPSFESCERDPSLAPSSVVSDEEDNKTFADVVKQNLKEEKKTEVSIQKDFSILFKKLCHSCNYTSPNSNCNYIHENDDNYYFYSLPLNKRCLRSLCFDLSCLRSHHSITERLSVKCEKPVCNCKHYVHPNDTNVNKPYFWKSFDESSKKPSVEESKNYFLLKFKK